MHSSLLENPIKEKNEHIGDLSDEFLFRGGESMKVYELIEILKQYGDKTEVEMDYGGTILPISGVYEKDEDIVYIG